MNPLFSYAVTGDTMDEHCQAIEDPSWMRHEYISTSGALPEYGDTAGCEALARVSEWTYNRLITPDSIMVPLMQLAQGTDPYGNAMSQAERAVLADDVVNAVAQLSQLARDRTTWISEYALPWINNAAEVAWRYTEQHGGCNAGKSEFLQAMQLESPAREFYVTVTATQNVTVTANSEDEATEMAAEYIDRSSWDLDDSYNWTVEEQ